MIRKLLRQLRYTRTGLRDRLVLPEWRSLKADAPGLTPAEALDRPLANDTISSELRERIEATVSARLERVSPLPRNPILAGQILVLSAASVALGASWLGD